MNGRNIRARLRKLEKTATEKAEEKAEDEFIFTDRKPGDVWYWWAQAVNSAHYLVTEWEGVEGAIKSIEWRRANPEKIGYFANEREAFEIGRVFEIEKGLAGYDNDQIFVYLLQVVQHWVDQGYNVATMQSKQAMNIFLDIALEAEKMDKE